MYKCLRNILFFSFLISSTVYPCVRGDNCFIPEANAGEDKTYYIGSTVTLDGTSSYDPENSENESTACGGEFSLSHDCGLPINRYTLSRLAPAAVSD